MLLVTHPWERVREEAPSILRARRQHAASGFLTGTPGEELVLRGAVVVLAPPAVLDHWHAQATHVDDAMAAVHGVHPVSLKFVPGNMHDVRAVASTLADRIPDAERPTCKRLLHGDKGYDSEAARAQM